MTSIIHRDILDLRTLGELANELRDLAAVYDEDENFEEYDFETNLDEDDRETLDELIRFWGDELGHTGEDRIEIGDALIRYGDQWEPTLIAADHFEDYARELAVDIGAISGEEGWPLNHIDWEAAADALKMDYTEVTLDGHEYYIRTV